MSSFEHLKACSAIIINYDVFSIGYKQLFFSDTCGFAEKCLCIHLKSIDTRDFHTIELCEIIYHPFIGLERYLSH